MNFSVLKNTIFGCAVMLLSAMPMAGMLLLIFIPLVVGALAKSGFLVLRKRVETKVFITKLLMWSSCVMVVLLTHYIRHHDTRRMANDVVLQIEQFHQENSVYPESILEVGLTEKELRKNLIMGFYDYSERGPLLVYAVTYMPFETYHYDFKEREWVQR